MLRPLLREAYSEHAMVGVAGSHPLVSAGFKAIRFETFWKFWKRDFAKVEVAGKRMRGGLFVLQRDRCVT